MPAQHPAESQPKSTRSNSVQPSHSTTSEERDSLSPLARQRSQASDLPTDPKSLLRLQRSIGNHAVQRLLKERTAIRRAIITHPDREEEKFNTEENIGRDAVRFLIIKYFTAKNMDNLLHIMNQIKLATQTQPRTRNEQELYRLADEKVWALQVDESEKKEWTPESINHYGAREIFKLATKKIVNNVLKDVIPGAQQILEIGAGMGFLANLIESPYREKLTRTDIGKKIVEYWSNTKTEPSGDFYKSPVDATALTDKFGIQQFDAVVGLNVLDTLDAPTLARVFSSVHQVLKPGGYLLHFMDVNALIGVAYDEIIKQGNTPSPVVADNGQLNVARAFSIPAQTLKAMLEDTQAFKEIFYRQDEFKFYVEKLQENAPELLQEAQTSNKVQAFFIALRKLAEKRGINLISLDQLFENRISPLFDKQGYKFLGQFNTISESIIAPSSEVIKGELPGMDAVLNRGDFNYYPSTQGLTKEQTKLTIHVHVLIARKQ